MNKTPDTCTICSKPASEHQRGLGHMPLVKKPDPTLSPRPEMPRR